MNRIEQLAVQSIMTDGNIPRCTSPRFKRAVITAPGLMRGPAKKRGELRVTRSNGRADPHLMRPVALHACEVQVDLSHRPDDGSRAAAEILNGAAVGEEAIAFHLVFRFHAIRVNILRVDIDCEQRKGGGGEHELDRVGEH